MSEEIQSGSSTEDLDGQTVKGDEEDIRAFRLGAVIAQNFELYADCEGLTPDENDALESEIEHKWRQPWYLWLIVILCSICAAVQGMDETVVNGAQIFYSIQFGIGNKTSSRDSWLVGLVNSAPYLCCALIGCWLTVPMNKYLGRRGTIQAARDIFYMHTLLEIEKETMVLKKNPILELIKVPRNRRAFQASEIVMFMQQFCGVNVIAYYSSEIFLESGFDEIRALSASLGFGIINFLFALPAVWTIDRFGRRNLLLTTFPIMSLCLFFTGFSFWIPEGSTAKVACIALGIYIFGIFYSPGPGPVPFTYSAEAYPLYIRPLGMSCATATTWFFNFVLSITWPSLLKAFKPQGAFSWYACWNIIGFLGVLFFVPETKGRSLEELDQVFSVRTRDHAAYGARQVGYFINRYILRKDVEPEDLYALKEVEHRPDSYQTEKPTDPVERV
ncbi:putative metabolite transport protein ywtG [Glarea lozoyensis 74030]|uniref:Putative metabolite transport protein ywtG n=1 Tax=Glarea lozoyensis (strain ATCC 74030 / MF5533) TaxID=1104152 RepID=H0EMF8_GLAL7|nr:putative metabolite transport protein ywtG [Glarea lozoyensis 74030]